LIPLTIAFAVALLLHWRHGRTHAVLDANTVTLEFTKRKVAARVAQSLTETRVEAGRENGV
jgi:hypothetical protein